MRHRPPTAALLLAAAVSAGRVFPDPTRIKPLVEVQRVDIGRSTRDELRTVLGEPRIVDTPELYVYEWEKSKTIFLVCGGYGACGGATLGYTGTRALFAFDDKGLVARAEIKASTATVKGLP